MKRMFNSNGGWVIDPESTLRQEMFHRARGSSGGRPRFEEFKKQEGVEEDDEESDLGDLVPWMPKPSPPNGKIGAPNPGFGSF